MKFLMMTMLLSTFVFANPTGSKKNLPVIKEDKIAKDKVTSEKLKMLDQKEEDCDDKAKKPVEIKPEAISLTGNAGCTLE
jgi:hypothetical protein